MRRCALLLFLVACPKAPEPKCPEQPAPVVAPAPPPPKLTELDDLAVISQSHALLDASDKADTTAFAALTGSAFVYFYKARFYDAPTYGKTLQARVDAKLPASSRTCADEKVFRSPASATYIGTCTIKVPAHGDMPMTTTEAFETIVWAPEGEKWTASYWQGARAGVDAEREDWNDVFRTSAAQFKTAPNQFLIDTTRGRRPGAALDVAMGQGRNAIYLAQQKWRVTGLDISDEGIKIAKETAAAQKLKLETVQQDFAKYDFGTSKWDLVTLIYAGDDPKLIERIKPSIRRGGLFVVEYFHEDSTQGTGLGGFATGELAKLFTTGWKIVTDQVVDDVADWGLRRTKLVRFAAERL